MTAWELREPRPRLFRSEEYERLAALGTFEVIVALSPLSVAHNAAVLRLSEALHEAYGKKAWVRVQMTFRVGASMPEPDLVCAARERPNTPPKRC